MGQGKSRSQLHVLHLPLGRGHLLDGLLLFLLGNRHQEQGRLAEAGTAYAQATLQATSCAQPNFHNLAYILQAWGGLDLRQGRGVRAERHLRRGLQYALRAHEPHHEDVLSLRQDLANLLIHAKRFAEAEPILAEMVAASNHPDFGAAAERERFHNNLGFVQVQLEEFPKAELNLREALRQPSKDGHCFVIKNLGLMYQKMGYIAESIREYERALALFGQHHRADHPVAGFIREALAELRQG
jgi:tetratricopeptide (TPR) repeat protein